MTQWYSVSIWSEEKVLELGCGDGGITLGIYLMPLHCMI